MRIFENCTSVRIEITANCNLRCKYCHNDDFMNNPRQMTNKNISSVLEQLVTRYDKKKVLFTGGEPLLNANLEKYIKLVVGLGAKADMVTNGTMLDLQTMRKLESAGLSRIRISIDGVEGKDEIRGVQTNDLWGTATSGVRNTMLNICVHTVAGFHNARNLFDIYLKLIESGAHRWRVFDMMYQGRMLKEMQSNALVSYYDDYLQSVEKIISHYIKNGLDKSLDIELNGLFKTNLLKIMPGVAFNPKVLNSHPCNYLLHSLTLRSDGRITHCQYNHDTCADLFKHGFDLEKAFENRVLMPIEKIKLGNIKKCAQCKYAMICHGGCRARAEYLTGSLDYEDPIACRYMEFWDNNLLPLLREENQEALRGLFNQDGKVSAIKRYEKAQAPIFF